MMLAGVGLCAVTLQTTDIRIEMIVRRRNGVCQRRFLKEDNPRLNGTRSTIAGARSIAEPAIRNVAPGLIV